MRAWETGAPAPAARSEGLLIEPVGDETVIYDTKSKEAHCLKPLAAIVFDRSDGHATIDEIARIAEDRLAKPVDVTEVADAVAQLEGRGLLKSVLVVHTGDQFVAKNGDGVSRREMIRRVGFAGAVAATATSLVTSILPSAALAASGLPSGCTGCGGNSDCASNHCCQQNPGKSCNQGCCAGSNNSCHITVCRCEGGARSGATCLFSTCPGGTCVCQCSVCATEVPGGICPTCPSGSSSCCSSDTTVCTAPLL